MCFSEKKPKKNPKNLLGLGLSFATRWLHLFSTQGCYAKEHGMEKRQPACKSTSVWFLFKD